VRKKEEKPQDENIYGLPYSVRKKKKKKKIERNHRAKI